MSSGLIAHFFLVNSKNIPLSGCTIVYLLTEVHLGCSHVLAVVNQTAVNLHL